MSPPAADHPLVQARTSLRQSLSALRQGERLLSDSERAQLRPELVELEALLDKLERRVIRIAAFGLVSRGKSAVLNALLGRRLLKTGPLHGVTQTAQTVAWSPPDEQGVSRANASNPSAKVQIELIDTPGLDEIDGETRATIAREVARQADLILFVIAGDFTRVELQALRELHAARKPILLVFNKIDLYPNTDRQSLYAHLTEQRLQHLLSPDDIVMAAAEPAPLRVRVQWPDGRVTWEWEAPPPQVSELKQKILALLNRQGPSLLARNALATAQDLYHRLNRKKLQLRQEQAEQLLWRLASLKSALVALNPVPGLDLLAGLGVDLALVLLLSRTYTISPTPQGAQKLLKTLALSAGGLTLSELGGGLLLGLGSNGDGGAGVGAWLSAAVVQGAVAGYTAYLTGRATQTYLLDSTPLPKPPLAKVGDTEA
ncbi:GTP-binding protein [Leptolyngbya sp. FACHB-261]|uniref:GTP-binding protein n=1 Tax=Leptolyngbya sp. FACHB-261 TaxID=2692806 RepID=UPI00168692AC|nr:GTP-binding protein [Leptolyngbya sp. FACHB-261]MBD2102792.1 DUF697 domain-containing protein [Leptolyngbya sp. FACHB-261]